MIGHFVFSLGLLGLSGLLIDHHLATWRLSRNDKQDDARALRFARTKHRRRMLASSTIGVVGVLVALWPLVPRSPLWISFYLGSLLCSFAIILLCGLFDALATTRLFRESQLEQKLEQARLAVEIERSARQASTDTQADDT